MILCLWAGPAQASGEGGIRAQWAAGKGDSTYLESRRAYEALLGEIRATAKDTRDNAAALTDFSAALVARLAEVIETRATGVDVGGLRPKSVSLVDFTTGFLRFLAVETTEAEDRQRALARNPYQLPAAEIEAEERAALSGTPRTHDLELIFLSAWITAELRSQAMAPTPNRESHKEDITALTAISGLAGGLVAGTVVGGTSHLSASSLGNAMRIAEEYGPGSHAAAELAEQMTRGWYSYLPDLAHFVGQHPSLYGWGMGLPAGLAVAYGAYRLFKRSMNKFDTVTAPNHAKAQTEMSLAAMDSFFAEIAHRQEGRDALAAEVKALLASKDLHKASKHFCALMLAQPRVVEEEEPELLQLTLTVPGRGR